MSDELNVWRDASRVHHNCPFGDCDAPDELAVAVIRTYGDERHAAGYQAAIADVVEWLLSVGKEADEILPNGGTVARRFSREATRRFGKGHDHG